MVLNFDNGTSRNIVDMCYRTTKTLVNPIIDWSENEVWNYLNENGIKHCCLYDEGFKRIGCIGCPMNTKAEEEFERWPKYKEHYIKTFDRMLEQGKEAGIEYQRWKNGNDVFEWWLSI